MNSPPLQLIAVGRGAIEGHGEGPTTGARSHKGHGQQDWSPLAPRPNPRCDYLITRPAYRFWTCSRDGRGPLHIRA
jgi:hypothetical protein